MNKLVASGVTGLLLLGTLTQASAASAAFEQGNFILSVFDTVAQIEKGVDLGKFDVTQNHASLKSGLNFSSLNRNNGHVALWSDNYYKTGSGLNVTNWYDGFLATTNSTGTADLATALTVGGSFHSADVAVRGAYDAVDVSGVASLSTANPSSYFTKMSQGDTLSYQGLNKENNMAKLPTAGSSVDLYLYEFETGTDRKIKQVGSTYAGIIRLTADGNVSYKANEVPVPGAFWLLGSGLLGLVGIRRRMNG